MAPPSTSLTPRARVLLPIFLVVLVLLSYYRLRPSDGRRTFAGSTMGTSYEVVLGASADAPPDLAAKLQAELDRIESLMSTYREDSELSRFNRHRSSEPFIVSADTARVVLAAQRLSRESGGAFDVTVQPLVALWGFGAGARTQPPDERQLQAARRAVGYELLGVEQEPPSLSKQNVEVSCDLSAIAKGYGVDRLADVLAAEGLSDYLVEVGGELRVSGSKAPGHPWRVGIELPDSRTRGVAQMLEVGTTGMATSGDYRSYYEKDGLRVSHTVDPRTGKPIAHRLASVTVLHPEAMMADGYATALNVLGPDEGLALARRLELAAAFIVRTPDGGFETITTAAFDALTSVVSASADAK